MLLWSVIWSLLLSSLSITTLKPKHPENRLFSVSFLSSLLSGVFSNAAVVGRAVVGVMLGLERNEKETDKIPNPP